MVYDFLLLVPVCMLYGLVFILISKAIAGITIDRPEGLLFQFGLLTTILGFFCYFWCIAGQTLGMKAWRLKIVDANTPPDQHTKPTIQQCVIRLVTAPISWALLPLSLLIPRLGLLHERLSNTELIRVSSTPE